MENKIPDYTAFVTDNPEHINQFLSILPKHSHIYLVSKELYNSNKVTTITCDNIREQAGEIYNDMFSKRLSHIYATESCNDLNVKISQIIGMDRGFSFGSGGIRSIENLWENIPVMIKSPSIDSLKDIFKDKPCVIVSSGPSLNKNIDVLQKYNNNVIVIACGTAVAALKKHNITPHFVVNIDPFEEMQKFILPYVTKDTTLITSSVGCHGLVNKYPGTVVWFSSMEGYKIMEPIRDLIQMQNLILTNATVTTTAFSLALFTGASPIVLIGQDMAFEDENKVHADGIKNVPEGQIIEVESIDGKKMKTTVVFKEVSDYFNLLVPQVKDQLIINATEGGLGIIGCQHDKLKNVAKTYFTKNLVNTYNIKYNIINKSKVLSRLCLLKQNIEQLIKYSDMFSDYVNLLIQNNVNIDFVKNDIDEWFDNIRQKNGYNCVHNYANWIWYLITANDNIDNKLNMLNLFKKSLNDTLLLIVRQIEKIQ